ncbi:right-handed parallel beta-helix repeat-containing protein [Halohasta salina]|uniref:right-handed parallel beta-helix repeat-containing protein n=1 Tax=Halohasta salina TaxID=2961621 RepID=UPI0020A27C7A|nr:right-handed parallel beta-helix repeat-containing protein [Halohasta salina]
MGSHRGTTGRSVGSRRAFLARTTRVVGGTVAATAIAGVAGATADGTVDLGAQGLTTGAVVDPYLEEWFVDGARVSIPAGSYAWHGGGFEGATENAAVVGDGDVRLDLTGDAFRNNVRAESGTIELRNLTVGGRPSDKSHFRLETAADAEIVADNVDFPDGAADGTKCRPFYVPRDHGGTVDIRNCYFWGFSDNGIYASSPGYDDGAGGRVIVENCVSHNNNIAGIRIGSDDSVVRNCLVVNDGPAPESRRGQLNMRGIRVRNPGENIRIEDCEIRVTYPEASSAIELHEGADGGSGVIRNVTIYNDASSEAIEEEADVADGWEATGVEITGAGDLSYPDAFESVCTGPGCAEQPAARDGRIREILSADVDPELRV